MKKCILSIAVVLLLGGFASAQKASTSPVKSNKPKTVENRNVQKPKVQNNQPVFLKDSSDHPAKLKLDLPPVDTTEVVIPKRIDD